MANASFQVLMQRCLYILVVLMVLVLEQVDAEVHEQVVLKMISSNATMSSFSSGSKWHREAQLQQVKRGGCRWRPWVCWQGCQKRYCCHNRCVNVHNDLNNCGVCGIRCPFRWQCCGGFCINVMINKFHCGSCAHRCPFGSLCLFGLCGYAASTELPLSHSAA